MTTDAISALKDNVLRLKNTVNAVKMYGNPETYVRSLLEKNPKAEQAMAYVKENGGDPKAAFYKLAKENGISGDEIMNIFWQ